MPSATHFDSVRLTSTSRALSVCAATSVRSRSHTHESHCTHRPVAVALSAPSLGGRVQAREGDPRRCVECPAVRRTTQAKGSHGPGHPRLYSVGNLKAKGPLESAPASLFQDLG